MEKSNDFWKMNENVDYLPPRIEVVDMKVERGFAGSCDECEANPGDGGDPFGG